MVTNSKKSGIFKDLEQVFKICGKDVGIAALRHRVADYYLENDKDIAMFLKEMEQYDKPRLSGDAASDNNKEPKRTHARKKKPATRPRETMTFRCKSCVSKGHLTLLHAKLTEEEWIDGIEGDFKALFSGKRDEACSLTWLGKYGNGTLVELFRQLVGEGLVIVPNGYSLPYILEGHFHDQEGEWLTRLDKGDKPNEKALPVIKECVSLMKMSVDKLFRKLRGETEDEEDDFKSVYDPYDHQDLNLHKWK